MFFSLFIFLCCFPFCFPVVLPYCIPRCTTPSLGRSPRANRWKNDDLGLVPIFKNKYFTKICDFRIFSFDLYTDSILKQLNKLKNINIFFFTFHFSLLFPVLFPRCGSLLYSPLHYPVVGSKSSSQSLKNDALGLVPIFQKKNPQNLWFSIFPSIYIQTGFWKQLNKLKILNIFFHFSFFSVVSRFVSPLCFSIVFPVALPRRWVEVLEPFVEKMMT